MNRDRLRRLVARHPRALLAALLLLGLLVRLPLLPYDYHNSRDLSNHRDWARALRDSGLTSIYDQPRVNYPPLSLYLFGSAIAVDDQLPADWHYRDHSLTSLLKLPAILADVLTAGLIALAIPRRRPGLRLAACAAYLFNPAIWYVSAQWGQIDSVYALFLVAAIVAVDRRDILPAWLAYALAVGSKLQSLALGPLLLVATLARRGWKSAVAGMAAAGALLAALALPWLLAGRALDVLSGITRLPNNTPYVDRSAYNLWYLVLGGKILGVSSQLQPAGLPVTYQQIGLVLFAAFVLLVVALVWRHPDAPLAIPAALLSLGFFALPTEVHERHMFAAIPFLILAAVARPRLWIAYFSLSLTYLYNLVTAVPYYPSIPSLLSLEATAPEIVLLKALAFMAAIINLFILGWLLRETALNDERAATVAAEGAYAV